MKFSWELGGILTTLGVLLVLPVVLVEGTTRLMVSALVIVLVGGAMAFVRSRKATRR